MGFDHDRPHEGQQQQDSQEPQDVTVGPNLLGLAAHQANDPDAFGPAQENGGALLRQLHGLGDDLMAEPRSGT